MELKSIHLEFQNIRNFESLFRGDRESGGVHQLGSALPQPCTLLLIKNEIKTIEGLETLISLEYLALNNNQISVIEGLSTLVNLQGLNLSHNRIEYFRGDEFPKGLQLLYLKDNPVSLVLVIMTQQSDYRLKIVKYLK